MVNLQQMDLWVKSRIPAGARNHASDHDFLVHDYQFMIDIERKHRTPAGVYHLRYGETIPDQSIRIPGTTKYRSMTPDERKAFNIYSEKQQALLPIFNSLGDLLGASANWKSLDLGRKSISDVLIPIYENFLRLEKLTAQQRQMESEAQRQLLIQSRISGAAETRLSQRVREQIRRENPQATGMQIDQLVKEKLFPTEPEAQPAEIELKSYYVWSRFSVITIPSRPGLVFPIKQIFSQPKLSDSQVTQLRNLGKTVILADFVLTGSPIQRGIDEMNKIAERNTGIKEIRIG
jgi:hypothetical protein